MTRPWDPAAFNRDWNQPWSEGDYHYERVVAFKMPCPLALMPELLRACGRWHEQWCDRPGCELVVGGDQRGDHQLTHRWPIPAEHDPGSGEHAV